MTSLTHLSLPNGHWTQTLKSLTPVQRERAMYWVSGLAPLATNVTTPAFTSMRFNHTQLSEEEKRKNIVQEMARQLVSAGTHVLTYFGSSLLAGTRLRGDANKNLKMFLIGTFGAFLGYAVVRPLISAELILRWLYPNDGDASTSPNTPQSKGLSVTRSRTSVRFNGMFRVFGPNAPHKSTF
jgi:hypothetical protein